MTTATKAALPGERWLANLEAIDETSGTNPRQGVVKLVDFDARTKIWNVEPEDEGAPKEVTADNLVERVT
jgi:cation diffusion facilitator CzcD-associated flavoprotein CzcO